MTLWGALGLGFGALSLVAGLVQSVFEGKATEEEIKKEVREEYDRREKAKEKEGQ